jgi:uncharacterized protein (UPF0335 family)
MAAQIAAMLQGEHPSQDIQRLLRDVDQEIERLSTEESALRDRATDPLTGEAEADGFRATLFDISFRIQRLGVAQERLNAALTAAQRREADHRRRADYERALSERDAIAEELRTVYPEAAARIAELLRRICRNNALVTLANKALPAGASQIEPVELLVRNVAQDIGVRMPDGSFTYGYNTLTQAVRLPALAGVDAMGGRDIWAPDSSGRLATIEAVELAGVNIAA